MTEQRTSGTVSDLPVALPDLSASTALEATASDSRKVVAIHMVPPSEMTQCAFWLGLFQGGKLSPSELLSSPSIESMFHDAATNGLAESGPVMLSDSSMTPAKFIYLLPKPGEEEAYGNEWIDNLVTTVKSWSPEKTGIYLAPELLEGETNQKLLGFIMKKLIAATKTTDYFLMPGAQGINQLLNTSIRIKQDLESEKILVYVFH